jgi:hypothetical protein
MTGDTYLDDSRTCWVASLTTNISYYDIVSFFFRSSEEAPLEVDARRSQ